ncbi:MAG TPA: hypothetical protein DCQ73_02045 [Spirochaetaceae bacterium]|nr:hypothetical protein [Spirochaetaceae bacterium]
MNCRGWQRGFSVAFGGEFRNGGWLPGEPSRVLKNADAAFQHFQNNYNCVAYPPEYWRVRYANASTLAKIVKVVEKATGFFNNLLVRL